MNLTLDEPEKANKNKDCDWPKTHWTKLFASWFEYNGVFMGSSEMSYNYFHHFFDVSLYETNCKSGESAIKKMKEYLKTNHPNYDESATWKCQREGDQIKGVRFFIYAENIKELGSA